MIDKSIFREYDIRGIVPNQINDLSIKAIARAIAIKCINEKVDEVALGRDGRLSGDKILRSLSSELQSLGINVLNIGIVTSPLLYFAAKKIKSKSGVMITGSHNPKNYNGFKIVINDSAVSGIEIHNLISDEISNFHSSGSEIIRTDIMDEYINEVIAQASSEANPMKIVIDCGNGSASEIVPKLIRSLGHQVIELFCKIDGNFPNHHPDPGKIENLQDLIKAVKSESADIGIAFDGDGDRLGVVSSNGEIIFPDQLMMIFSKEVLKSNKGKEIVFDVKCTNLLNKIISDAGGIPMMSPTGHFHIKNTLKKTKAPLAGEMSGHIFFNDKWYGFDDAHYAAFRLIEILKKSKSSLDNLVKDLPKAFSTPEMNLNVDENKKFQIVEDFIAKADFGNAEKITIDGLRVNFEDGWGLLRASNTTPKLVLRFEANCPKRLSEIENIFLTQLKKIDETINIELS